MRWNLVATTHIFVIKIARISQVLAIQVFNFINNIFPKIKLGVNKNNLFLAIHILYF